MQSDGTCNIYDAPAIREIVRSAAPGKYTFSALVLGVVKKRSIPDEKERGVGEFRDGGKTRTTEFFLRPEIPLPLARRQAWFITKKALVPAKHSCKARRRDRSSFSGCHGPGAVGRCKANAAAGLHLYCKRCDSEPVESGRSRRVVGTAADP